MLHTELKYFIHLIKLQNIIFVSKLNNFFFYHLGNNFTYSINLDKYNKTSTEDQAFTELISLKGNSNNIINVVNIPIEVSFVIIQVHSYLYNVSMSYDNDLSIKPRNSVSGTNIGLFSATDGAQIASVYAFNQNPFDVDGLIAVVAYTSTGKSCYKSSFS